MTFPPKCLLKSKSLARNLLWLIVLLSIGIRLGHVFSINYRPVSDMDAYLSHSRLLGTDDPRLIYTTLFPPGYTWFLWVVERFVELDKPQIALTIQVLLAGITTAMIYAIAALLHGRRTGLIAALIYAIYKPAVLSAGLLQSETLTEFYFVASALGLLKFLQRPKAVWFIIMAVCTSLAVHTRVNMISIVPVYLICLLVYAVRSPGKACRYRHAAALVALPLLLGASFLPWTLRNSRLHDALTFISSNGGQNLLQGNNAYTEGGWYTLQEIYDPAVQTAMQAPPPQRPALFSKAASDFIRSHPVYELFYLIPKRIEYVFHQKYQVFWPWQMVIASNYWTHPFGPYFYVPLVPYLAVIVLGLAGFLLRGRGRMSCFLPVLWLAVLPPILMVHGNGRFHYISDWLLVITGAVVINRVFIRVPIATLLQRSAVVLFIMTLTGTFVQWLRLGSGNLLADPAATLHDGGRTAMEGTLEMDSDSAKKDNPLSAPLASIPVSPGMASHLLISADVSVEQEGNHFYNPNLFFEFTNAQDEATTRPNYAKELLPPNVFINPNVGPQRFWRITNVPGSARHLTIRYHQDFPGKVEIKNFKVTGPIWN